MEMTLGKIYVGSVPCPSSSASSLTTGTTGPESNVLGVQVPVSSRNAPDSPGCVDFSPLPTS